MTPYSRGRYTPVSDRRAAFTVMQCYNQHPLCPGPPYLLHLFSKCVSYKWRTFVHYTAPSPRSDEYFGFLMDFAMRGFVIKADLRGDNQRKTMRDISCCVICLKAAPLRSPLTPFALYGDEDWNDRPSALIIYVLISYLPCALLAPRGICRDNSWNL